MPSHSTHSLFLNFLSSVANEFPFGQRLVLSVFRSVRPILDLIFASDRTLNTMIRTLVAPMALGSGKLDGTFGLLPQSGRAKMLVSKHPLDSIDDVQNFYEDIVRRSIGSELLESGNIILEMNWIRDENELNEVIADVDCNQFGRVAEAIKTVFNEDILVGPALFISTADIRHYRGVAKQCYNFNPFVLDAAEGDLDRFHGPMERVSVESMVKAVEFYDVFFRRMLSVDDEWDLETSMK